MTRRRRLTTAAACFTCAVLSATQVVAEGPADARAGDWVPIPRDGVISAPGNYFLERDVTTDRKTGIQVTVVGIDHLAVQPPLGAAGKHALSVLLVFPVFLLVRFFVILVFFVLPVGIFTVLDVAVQDLS